MAPRIRRSLRRHYPDLAAYLAESGDSQAGIAEACQTSQATISRIATGDMVPRPILASRIARYCGIPLDSFTRTYLARRTRRSA